MAASATIVPKGPTVDQFDRARLLAQLFSLPLPPKKHGRRPFPTHTPLGYIIRLKDLSLHEVSQMPGCPYSRTMTEYVAGRKVLSPEHRRALARALGVDPRIL